MKQVDPTSVIKHGLAARKSNAATHSLVFKIFMGLVEMLRSPTGKSRGSRLFWLPSLLTCVSPSVARSSASYQRKYDRSFYGKFMEVLKNLFIAGR